MRRVPLLALCLLLASASAEEAPPTAGELLEAERLNGVPLDLLRYDDLTRARRALGQGGDLLEQFVRLIFPISGREKRTGFLPFPYWGPKKPAYSEFEWRRYQSPTFDFYAYPEGENMLPAVVGYLEEDHDWKNRIFGVENRFSKKIPVIFYQSRRDFEQTHVIEGPVPEGLAGFAEIFSWRRVTFPFEGEQERLEHVARHEGTHIYQIAKGVRRAPLWFVEGSAETLSVKWDAQADMAIRDAYLNGFFFHLEDLWRIEGTWLMYKQGNFITNVLWDEYGAEGFRKFFENAGSKSFESNLKEAFGLTTDELDQKVFAELGRRYGHLLAQKDLAERSELLEKKKVLMHARGPFYVSGGESGARGALFLNYVSPRGERVSGTIVADRRYRNESLDHFRKGAWMDDRRVVYAIKRSARDVVRVHRYSFDRKRKKFRITEEAEYGWPGIPTIADPVLAGEAKIAFIGTVGGLPDIYLFDRSSGALEKLTEGGKHCSDLDYSAARNELLFSREDGPASARARWDRNLYTLNLESRVTTRLTHTRDVRESAPRFSPDGKRILYVADAGGTFDLFLYDTDSQESRRLTRERVGALRPQWGDGSDLLFNSSERLAPAIYRASFPTGPEILASQVPPAEGEEALLGREGLVMLPKKEKALRQPDREKERPPDGLAFTEGEGVLTLRGERFGLSGTAAFPDHVLLSARRGTAGSKEPEVDTQPHYFAADGRGIRSLASGRVDRKGLPPEIARRLEGALEGRALIGGWVTPDERRGLILVNNRISADSERWKRKKDVGVLLAELSTGRVEEIASGPLGDPEDLLQWVAFLEDRKLLLAVGDAPAGPFALHLYDEAARRYREIDPDAEAFRVSADRRRVAWRKREKLYELESSGGVTSPIRGIPSLPSEGVAFDYLEDGRLAVALFFGPNWSWRALEAGRVAETAALARLAEVRVLDAAVDPREGAVAVRVRPKAFGREEEVRLWSRPSGLWEKLPLEAARIERLVFRAGYLHVTAKERGKKQAAEYFFRGGQLSPVDPLRSGRKQADGSYLFEGERELLRWSPAEGRAVRLAGQTAGYAPDGADVIYSAFDGRRFAIYRFEAETKRTVPLVLGDRDAIAPAVQDGELLWSAAGEKGWELRRARMGELGAAAATALEGYDLLRPEGRPGESAVRVVPRPEPAEGEARRREPEPFPKTLRGEAAPLRFRFQSLAAAAAYDGNDFRFFVSGFADNLFSDRGIFVNATFLGDAQYATLGYTNLNSGNSVAGFYNSAENIRNGGIDVSKNFLLDRHRQITLFADFEVQDYGPATPGTAAFVTPEVENRTFYLGKAGAVYGYDVTVWDRHGPITGSRAFFKAETGADLPNARLANVDVNADFRLYHRILPRFGLAHRLVAGTSQGELPNVFLLGGNISFRGFGFDELKGQNYWVFSEDLRVPVFDFLGAKFFDPLDQVLGFLTRYFDVRAGIYADVGSVWFNGKVPLDHSVGYFVNVPTIFGVVFRLHHGFLGGKALGFWLGYNW